jgi:hypothetical protein
MSDELVAAHARARKVVGESLWNKLSESAQAAAISEETRLLQAETTAVVIPSPGH